ncbi:MAG: signal peptide peptidase SppA [Gammaproteobacteria bacterium]|nr:signal peptide peptidase SppA [Gammaproteobacteria bacterium]|tara:strand:- start:26032 stop:27873 length:1842 start_codon:yes stop_codon:yes gene_type:complete
MIAKIFRGLLTLYRWIRSFFLNLLFIVVLLTVLSVLFSGSETVEIPEGAALVIAPVGDLVEERTRISGFGDLFSGNPADSEVLLSDLLEVIEIAGRDDAISAIVLRLDALQGADLSKLQDIATSLVSFRESGKTVYALADNLSQSQYYIASHADEIILNEMGSVNLEGMSSYQYYYAEALANLDINVHIFRVGEYKSAVEPFELNGMSEEARENYEELLSSSWQLYLDGVSQQRGMPPEQINNLINTLDEQLAGVGGDTARLALESGLVDQISSRPDMQGYLISQVGMDMQSGNFLQVSYERYLQERRLPLDSILGGDQVGIIVASGTIFDGEQDPGSIGGDNLSALIRQAQDDENVKALVLRVDSPGGSAYASEVIRQQLLEFKDSGKPLVVSMGGVAASGGYWIATAAEEIWATPATITGSIGIFGIYPTFSQTLGRLGIYVDGVGTTDQAGAFGLGRELPAVTQNAIQLNVENGYQRFLTIVSDARNMSTAAVDAVGQGRVWSASAALEHGLLDDIGDLDDAVEAAAGLAGLNQYRAQLITAPLSPGELLLQNIADNWDISAWFSTGTDLMSAFQLSGIFQQLEDDLLQLVKFNDPNNLYLQCFACNRPL